MQLPSASNTTGTLLGALAGAAVAASAPSIPLIVSAAALLGMTPVGLAGIVALGATAFVNYVTTHIAEVGKLNELVKEFWPQIEATYPQNSKTAPSTSVGSSNGNYNKPPSV